DDLGPVPAPDFDQRAADFLRRVGVVDGNVLARGQMLLNQLALPAPAIAIVAQPVLPHMHVRRGGPSLIERRLALALQSDKNRKFRLHDTGSCAWEPQCTSVCTPLASRSIAEPPGPRPSSVPSTTPDSVCSSRTGSPRRHSRDSAAT